MPLLYWSAQAKTNNPQAAKGAVTVKTSMDEFHIGKRGVFPLFVVLLILGFLSAISYSQSLNCGDCGGLGFRWPSTSRITCDSCGGSGHSDAPSGWENCGVCDGTGKQEFLDWNTGQYYKVDCSYCFGNGLVMIENPVPIDCDDCFGWGYIIDNTIEAITCEVCGGTGLSVPGGGGGNGGGTPPPPTQPSPNDEPELSPLPPPANQVYGMIRAHVSDGTTMTHDMWYDSADSNILTVKLGKTVRLKYTVASPDGWLSDMQIYLDEPDSPLPGSCLYLHTSEIYAPSASNDLAVKTFYYTPTQTGYHRFWAFIYTQYPQSISSPLQWADFVVYVVP
ncbi:hypothetical protein OH491_12180 [Termitidicoccus mucosus]|uniref:hypothetical protein n=1 Tax=Termitidicoccus mucosus TaxID=1184151 RepID=UPI0011AB6692